MCDTLVDEKINTYKSSERERERENEILKQDHKIIAENRALTAAAVAAATKIDSCA